MSKLTLGSLFSGIGGFELAAQMYGIEPVWASEIEEAPIRITKRHFPNMKHIGDITKIDGGKIDPVDIISGGSPCQSLSVAGKQAGISRICQDCGFSILANSDVFTCPECGAELELTRSGLFVEQIRIIKEMREATNGEYPKFIIWENVFGSLSSNNGDDFYCVLREFAGLFGEELPTFRPKQWTKAGELLGKSGSLAWRTLDAQYWGVPQRRRRIFLVTDLGGQRAREVLFKPESLRRHTPKGEIPWKRTSGKAESSTGKTGTPDVAETTTYGFEPGASARLKGDRLWPELSGTLRAQMGDNQMSVLTEDKSKEPEVYGICSMGSNSMKSNNPNSGFYKADVAKTLDTTGTDPTCNQGGNVVVQEPVYCIQGNCIDRADTAGCNGKGWKEDVSYTLTTIDRPAVAYAVHSVRENGSGDVWLADVSSTLTTGGGKIGQGYSGVLIEALEPPSEKSSAAFAYQVGPKNPYFPYNEELSPTLVANQKMGVLIENHPADSRVKISDDGVCQTLSARMGTGGGNVPLVMETEDSTIAGSIGGFMQFNSEKSATLLSRDYKDPQIVYKSNSIVRRLTPVECERLQGFPSDWTYPESDAARYKALGNSVAVPCVAYIMSGIADVLDPIK